MLSVVNYMTKKKFINWLRSKHPRTKVGTGFNNSDHSSWNCPAGQYLQVKYPGGRVGAEKYHLSVGGDFFSSPEWLRDFVKSVDRNTAPRIITAKKALEFLGEKG